MPICPQCLKENPELGAKCPRCADSYYVYDEAADDADRDPYIGRKAGDKYVIVARISEGGMGTVYRALQLPVEREVAFKVLRAELEDNDEVRNRFTREARAVSKINHPNIITLYDFGFDESDYPYMVMEYAPGQGLDDWIYSDGVDLERIVHVMRQMLSALADAHDQGVVHRDLKPENIMVTGTGTDRDFIKLLDFGIARLVNEQATEGLTREGEVFGTPHYMAPEQAEGETGIGPPADVYALGIMLYEMLCRECPFDAPKPLSILFKQINEELPPLSPRAGVTVPAALENLMRRATAKEPDQRFGTSGEMLEALDEIDNADRSGIVQAARQSSGSQKTTQRGIGDEATSRATVDSTPQPTAEATPQPEAETGSQPSQGRDKVATANTLGFDEEAHGERPEAERSGEKTASRPPNDVSVEEPAEELFEIDEAAEHEEDNSTILAVIVVLTVLVGAGFTTLTLTAGGGDSAGADGATSEGDAGETALAASGEAAGDGGAGGGQERLGERDAGETGAGEGARADQSTDTGTEPDDESEERTERSGDRDERAAGEPEGTTESAGGNEAESRPTGGSSESDSETRESGTGGTSAQTGGREDDSPSGGDDDDSDDPTIDEPEIDEGGDDNPPGWKSATDDSSEESSGSSPEEDDDQPSGESDDSDEIEKFGAPESDDDQEPEQFEPPSKFDAPEQ